MPSPTGEQVCFEVLLRSEATGRTPNADTIDLFRPSAESLERCRRWFASAGASCETTQFGLVCRMPRTAVELLFGVELKLAGTSGDFPCYHTDEEIRAPSELAHLIDQITIPRPPDMFGSCP